MVLLRRPDSNGERWNQNPMCCRYTTAQFCMLYPNGNVGSKFNNKTKFITGFIHPVCGRSDKRINVGFNLKFHSEIQQVKRHFRFHLHCLYYFREPARAVLEIQVAADSLFGPVHFQSLSLGFGGAGLPCNFYCKYKVYFFISKSFCKNFSIFFK